VGPKELRQSFLGSSTQKGSETSACVCKGKNNKRAVKKTKSMAGGGTPPRRVRKDASRYFRESPLVGKKKAIKKN